MFNWWWQLPWVPLMASLALIVLSVLGGLKAFWQKARSEHYDLWFYFDGLFYAAVIGFLAARLSYALMHFTRFWSNPAAIIKIWSYPGLWAPAGLVASAGVMIWVARQQKRDVFETLDFFSILMSWFLGFYWLSRFAVGAAAGVSTSLPIGLMFPQRVEPAHPIQIYAAATYLLLHRYLLWAEPRFRFFLWYRSKKRTAKSGYLTAVFMIITGLLGVLLGFIRYPFILVLDFEINQLFYAIMFTLGWIVLLARSGKTFLWKQEKGRYGASFPATTGRTETNSN